ncbi:Aminopeptidase C [Mycoplasmoides gallisepticum str. R(low)]|uniref:Aminopeptidase n=4 Tax=Mycoplasmoides gallisepticum TaxID=2096 RepID=Q7NB39_MYCGA|nr:C1 family peptidase [Mycoplasmoides gallisepticum]AAP56791.2 Aminopeptidase C [Mycoplasmoides gallisepticum str. R(low)]ADC30647.1 Aminopeptidase C [Mycoplasmoides gallisepticum str. R(high)]
MAKLELKDSLKQLNNLSRSKFNKQLTNILNTVGVKSVSYNGYNFSKNSLSFNLDLSAQPITNQFQTGRCWIFAGLNLLRYHLAKELNIDDLELSQSYLAFWDKFEKANYFLETVTELRDKKVNDRTLSFILKNGVADGGQWTMLTNLIKKYGLVPKSIMPDTANSASTNQLNYLINLKLNQAASKILDNKDKPVAELNKIKTKALDEVFYLLSSIYGELPTKFDFSYTKVIKKDSADRSESHFNYLPKKVVETNFTPLTFYQKYFKQLVEKQGFVSVINAPANNKPFNQTFSVKYLNNVIESDEILHYNLEQGLFSYLTIKQLVNQQPVWFGCEVKNIYLNEAKTFWDDQSFDYQTLFNIDLSLSKNDQLDYWLSSINHAMLITGVDLDLEKFNQIDQEFNQLVKANKTKQAYQYLVEHMDQLTIHKWKIENSWGQDLGHAGYFVISDSYFKRYTYQVAINRQLFNQLVEQLKLTKEFDKPVRLLEPWDPIGTLAK